MIVIQIMYTETIQMVAESNLILEFVRNLFQIQTLWFKLIKCFILEYQCQMEFMYLVVPLLK